jgi:hypothetical protein
VFSYVSTLQGAGLFEKDNIKVNYVTSKSVDGREVIAYELLAIAR